MTRFSSVIAALGLLLALAAAADAAPTCEPACGDAERCVCVCDGTQTTCDPSSAPQGRDCCCECKG